MLTLIISEDHEFRLSVENELGLVAETDLMHVIAHFENYSMLRFEIFCHQNLFWLVGRIELEL